ncbi:conserved hypothetical protein [Pseudomonas sp. 8BK]|uniref:hypothetical protein n=1 Tax=Pseudomonas sp. 8BK TaxID=2653164 RepID=UPI0012F10522|nr:hypothetical protein [Pseudomonas sp. 8BK]VXB51499.1 conserved hypothetical protein [Pseudomonas sp. 8BK]
MKFLVENNQIGIESVIYRELGFGEQLNPEGIAYRLEVLTDEIPESFHEAINSFIEQCKSDDKDQEISETPELQKLGYPDSQKLLVKAPTVLGRMIEDYLYFEFLNAIFKTSNTNAKFVINSIDRVDISGVQMQVFGKGFFRKI